MKTLNSDAVDMALTRFRAGESTSAILADFSVESAELGPILDTAAALEVIHSVEMPDSADSLADRNRFLASAASLQALTASPGLPARLRAWMKDTFPSQFSGFLFPGGQYRRLGAVLLMAALVLVLLVGVLGGTVAVAAESLPGSSLYPLKLKMEQARLAMATEPDERAAIYLTQANERIEEMIDLVAAAEVPDEEVLVGAQFRFYKAFEFASQTPDDVMLGLLIQAQQMVQIQEEALARTGAQIAGPTQKTLRQADGMLSEVQQAIKTGLEDPQRFRGLFSGHGDPDCAPNAPCSDSCGGNECQQFQTPKQQPEEINPVGDCNPGDCKPPQTQDEGQERPRLENGCIRGGCDQTQSREPTPSQADPGEDCDNAGCAQDHPPQPTQEPPTTEDSCGPGGCRPSQTREPVQEPPQVDSDCGQDDCQPSQPPEKRQEPAGPDPRKTPAPTAKSNPEPTTNPDPTSAHPDSGGSGGSSDSGSGSSDSGHGNSDSGGDSNSGSGKGK